ncbi:MAG: M48 family metallopeptidase [Bacteroidaceae bacterium]|nr:M48 family metallopeptidase [Bacteroidaceae bacterium]
MVFRITPHFRIDTPLLQFRLTLNYQSPKVLTDYSVGQCELKLPASLRFDDPRQQGWVNKAVGYLLQWQAQHLMVPMIERLAERGQLSYNRITFKNIRSRWGSCSTKRNLNFSVWLMAADPALIEYVVAHELAHLSQMNHSPLFWAEVDRLLGQPGLAKQRDKQLTAWQKELVARGWMG